ncbi:hypothetical protein F383_11365 [Gossypium arboreum]|uniref:Uncharacterized protein n=1 Tax=Gossypium arboreum TaxID=29729 RepID=A0A0B0NG87_GOSAR|nr:hypothetical protein F383_01605 [Gossypium arboreum]KHG29242.1 hypothetical protein F383_11365 [Gossypium arboreum]
MWNASKTMAFIYHRYVITSKTLSGIMASICCKTTSGTLALYDMCDYPSILFNSEWFNGK